MNTSASSASSDNPAFAAPSSRHWTAAWLTAAGWYNLAWGGLVILMPGLFFDLAGMPRPNYPQLWQCIGMIVGVYGIGYLIAARDPARHWPIVLVGLLGKIFGPIGFVGALWSGAFSPLFGLTILTNDLLWWWPFSAALLLAYEVNVRRAPGSSPRLSPAEAMGLARSGDGTTLAELADRRPTLVVFLRHSGCTFCREAAADLRAQRPRIEAAGCGIAVVTMSPPQSAAKFLATYGLGDVPCFSDPERRLYEAFELQRGRLGQLFGWRVWWRGLAAGVLGGHGVGALEGDGLQMPGAFIVHQGRIVRAFRHQTAADRPDYCQLAAGGTSGAFAGQASVA